MARTVLLFLLPAALVASGWRRLETGGGDSAAAGLLVLALLPALVAPWWGRVLAVVAAALAAVWAIFAIPPTALVPFQGESFFWPVAARFRDGVLGFWDVKQPFAVAEQPAMHDVVLVAIFGFALALAFAIALRRPLAASAILVLGSAWPATLVPGSGLPRGALTLAAVLLLLAAGGRRPTRAVRPALVTAALLVAAAVGASTSEAVAKPAFVGWQGWDFYDRPADPVGVGYVWNATYGRLDWPEEKTTVAKVSGTKRSLYWRATTLDTFVQDRWIEAFPVAGVFTDSTDITEWGDLDPLLPRRAFDRERWIEVDVKVEALRDEHLLGPSMPVAFEAPGVGRLFYGPGGVAAAEDDLPRGTEYTVWSYAPAPKPEQLARARRLDARAVARYLEVAPGYAAPVFGTPDREAQVLEFLATARPLDEYELLFRRARDVVGEPRNPYAAVVALEAWFRSEGGFTYDEAPPPGGTLPPLVAFLEHQRGYCQHFAGAMALMLRYLGIPARVAVGFSSGSYSKDDEEWTVTDHDAHAWVEVFFPDWGWLPFDPTPARAQFSGVYSSATYNFDALGAGRVLDETSAGGETARIARKLSEARAGEQFARQREGGVGRYAPIVRERGASLLKFLIVVAAAAAAGIVLVKRVVRGRRYLTRDARRLAWATRLDLTDFLLDQGIALPRSATPRELARELDRALGVDGRAFAQALSAARYAPPRESRAAARRLRHELRAVRRAIRDRLGVPRRALGAVSLRSLAA